MSRLPFFIICFFAGADLFGQTCTHLDLSPVLEFRTRIERVYRGSEKSDSCIVTITILKKKSKQVVQTISYRSSFLFDPVFKKCSFVRSYTTGKNRKTKVLDNNYGDLVVADFNFDGKEDLALMADSGVSDGPQYRFYLQTKSGRFIYDRYLSETVIYFPGIINPKNRTLTTYTLAGYIGVSQRVYRLDKMNNWKLVSKKLITT